MILDFKEIPASNNSDGTQDSFELFARDYFKNIGFTIISEPNRGADGGKDIIAVESRPGKYLETKVKWLISCKHKAHSGQSVTPDDEKNICDRVKQFSADGFMGFYSTIASSGLSNRLDSYKNDFEVVIINPSMIETELLKNENFDLARRYFPESSQKWISKNKLVKIFSTYHPLECSICHKDLLTEDGKRKPSGIIAFVNKIPEDYENENQVKEEVIDIYTACKGRCDRILENYWFKKGGSTGWEDIEDLASPIRFLSWNMAIINELETGCVKYQGESFNKLKKCILGISQLVMREPTEEEEERSKQLQILS